MRHAASVVILCCLALACERQAPRSRPSLRPDPPVARDASMLDAATRAPPDVADDDARAEPAEASVPVALPPAPSPRDSAREDPPEVDEFETPRRMQSVPLPAIPAAAVADVPRYRLLVAHAMRCWTTDGRLTHTAERGCPALYDQLVAGGATALHAMGTYLVDDAQRRLFRRERAIATTSADSYGGGRSRNGGDLMNNAETLAPTFARFDAPEVVPYVLMAVARPISRGYGDWGYSLRIQAWMDVLSTVTGNDITPVPPWQLETWDASQHMAFLADAHDSWCRWYRAHRSETVADWRAAGLLRARADLGARDTARRTAAILRLGAATASPEDREAARASLASLLAERRVSNDGRRYLRQLATQRGWSLALADAGVDASR